MERENRAPNSFGLLDIWNDVVCLPTQSMTAIAFGLFKQALSGMRRSPVPSLVSLLTVGGALFIVSLSLLIVQNLGTAVNASAAQVNAVVLLKDGSSDELVRDLLSALGRLPFVAEIKKKSKEEALGEFGSSLGASDSLLDGLREDNPLPASVEVTFRDNTLSQENLFVLRETAKQSNAVDDVISSDVAIGQLASLITWGKKLGFIIMGIVVGVSLLLIMSNVTLALYAHREEIEIMRLVGAKEIFVQGPFLMEGGIVGLLGGVSAMVVLYLGINSFSGAREASEFMKLLSTEISFLPVMTMLMLILSGIVVGVVGSALALRRWQKKY